MSLQQVGLMIVINTSPAINLGRALGTLEELQDIEIRSHPVEFREPIHDGFEWTLESDTLAPVHVHGVRQPFYERKRLYCGLEVLKSHGRQTQILA
jgi:hypothetical protein